jgi:hypothetical protein
MPTLPCQPAASAADKTTALVHVDEVPADGLVTDADLTGPGSPPPPV